MKSILERFSNCAWNEPEAVLVKKYLDRKHHRENLIGKCSALLIVIMLDDGSFEYKCDPSKVDEMRKISTDIVAADAEIARIDGRIRALEDLYAQVGDENTSLSMLRRKLDRLRREVEMNQLVPKTLKEKQAQYSQLESIVSEVRKLLVD